MKSCGDERSKKEFPQGVDYQNHLRSDDLHRQIGREVVLTIFIAILLVLGVVFLFLQNWRASIHPGDRIPVSLVGRLRFSICSDIAEQSFAIWLGSRVGIVVDDAIVVVENVERNMRSGMSASDAAHKTMDEVGGALISIALTLCAVFVLPLSSRESPDCSFASLP